MIRWIFPKKRTHIFIKNLTMPNGDGNKYRKNQVVLLAKQQFLHVHHTFLYIFLPLLYDVKLEKLPRYTFYG